MSNFSSAYKKVFRKRLSPNGYRLWKSVFYREASDDMCFFIRAFKERFSNEMHVAIDIVPYCMDLKTCEYTPGESGTHIIAFYKVLLPDIFAPTARSFDNFYTERFYATDDDTVLSRLNYLGDDMENLILPYLNRLTDLHVCYDELIKLFKENGCKDLACCFRQDELYGLSLKLHKYENALPHLDFQLARHKDIIKGVTHRSAELRKGDLMATFDPQLDSKIKEQLAKIILRKNPNYMEDQIRIGEEVICDSTKEIKRLQTIKEAVLSNDHVYLDKLVEETENNSREYLRQVMSITKI